MRLRLICLMFLSLLLGLTACNLDNPVPTATALVVATVTPDRPLQTKTPAPTNTALPGMPYGNADGIITGLCFGYLKTLVGKSIVLDKQADLTALYDQARKSKLCSENPVQPIFGFSSNQIVGTVVRARGCSLEINYQGTQTDDAAKKLTIQLLVKVEGECTYELLRPVWVVVPRSANTTEITITMP